MINLSLYVFDFVTHSIALKKNKRKRKNTGPWVVLVSRVCLALKVGNGFQGVSDGGAQGPLGTQGANGLQGPRNARFPFQDEFQGI